MNAAKTAMTLTLAGPRAHDVGHDTSLTDRANIVLHTITGVRVVEGAAETSHGVVTLRGRVGSAAQRAKAGLAVAGIDGVLGVRNLLEVTEEAELAETVTLPAPAEPADGVIKEKVEAALHSEGASGLQGLKVTDVDHGVVHMSGKGVTMTGRLRAVELAWQACETATANDGAPTGKAAEADKREH